MYRDEFGYMSRHLNVDFSLGEIRTLPRACDLFAPYRHRLLTEEKFYYPARDWSRRLFPLFRLPSSHSLTLDLPGSREGLRNGAAGFVMYALGYLEGLWLQFHDWWVDRPVPADSTHGAFVREDVIADFLSRSLQVWMQWNAKSQRQAIHMLYMHARAPSYFRWDWEQFLMEYITADACWRLARDVWGLKNVPHGGRLHAMCDHWGLEKDTKLLDAFVRLRNELVHQGLWGGRSITGSAFQVYDWEKEFPGERLKPHRAPQWLRHLNVQLIAAVLGYGRPHLPREWWTLTRQYFRSLGEQDEKIR